jgi:hypothetical protein
MRLTASLRCLLVLLLLALPAHPQLGAPLGRCGPHPPDPDWPKNQLPEKRPSSGDQKRQTLDMAKLQRDAHELSELAASIPDDVNRANRGVLSKDLIEKLKRVEKLSKQLRVQLTQ